MRFISCMNKYNNVQVRLHSKSFSKGVKIWGLSPVWISVRWLSKTRDLTRILTTGVIECIHGKRWSPNWKVRLDLESLGVFSFSRTWNVLFTDIAIYSAMWQKEKKERCVSGYLVTLKFLHPQQNFLSSLAKLFPNLNI